VKVCVDDPALARHGDADWLSLALMDARNHTLRWLAVFEAAEDLSPLRVLGLDPPRWLCGHAGWWQEWWIVRHVQTQRGEAGDAVRPRLASIEPQADALFDPAHTTPAGRWALPLPDPEPLRQYLAATLEAVLDVLASAGTDDAALHFHRLALWHEDRLAEQLAEAAQALGAPLPGSPLPPPPAHAERAPLFWPAQHFMLGSPPGGLVPPGERWAHEVAVPGFEIDAQAVSWARYAEFAADGGYDDPRWWSAESWAWLQAQGRRAPRHVEQWRDGVVLQRQGRLQRAAGQQPAVHVTRHEAAPRWSGSWRRCRARRAASSGATCGSGRPANAARAAADSVPDVPDGRANRGRGASPTRPSTWHSCLLVEHAARAIAARLTGTLHRRLRHQPVRRLHRAARRPRRQELHRAGAAGRGPPGHHHRGPGARGERCTRCRRPSSPATACSAASARRAW
jgi:gamma-glutamyl hercynylcysteine S-oxide synthase